MVTTILRAVSLVLLICEFVLVARAILSWFQTQGILANVYDFLYNITEPVLRPIRQLLLRAEFFRSMSIDFSPLLLLFLIELVRFVIRFWM